MAVRFLPPPVEGRSAPQPGDRENLAEVIDLRSRLQPVATEAEARLETGSEPEHVRTAMEDAVRLLARKARSSGELRRELHALGHDHAEVDGVVAGYAIATRGWLDGDIPLLGLGPIAVDPEYQGRGMGGALLTEIRERATLAGERAIVLLGHTGYYPRFGYVPAIPAGIMPSDPNSGEHFMVLALDQRTLRRGRFSYAVPFGV